MSKLIVIEGMDNLQMGRAVSRIFEGIGGVDDVKLDLDEQSIIVEFGRGALTEDELCDAINEEGFEVVEIFDA